jgi:endo-1,4-beta-xylanase
MKAEFVFVLLMAGGALAAERGQELPLWPQGAPGSEAVTEAEVSKPSVNPKYGRLPGNFTVAHKPSVYVFLPPREKNTGTAMVVAPGGGHRQLVMEKEGYEVADWLNDHGIAAIVLKYRLARAPNSKYALEREAHADAARAMRLTRSRAAEWGINPARIGFIGFSAGGEVAGMIGTKFNDGEAGAADPVERFGSRPDFNVLIYPYYRPGSAPPRDAQGQALIPIGENALFPIPANAPPHFMVSTFDDASHTIPTVKYYLELQAKNIATEMHIYEFGGHGYALRPTKKPGSPVEGWPGLLLGWLKSKDFLPGDGVTRTTSR